MKEANLWETNLNDSYIYFTNIEEYFNYLKENKMDLLFSLKSKYTPKDDPKNFLEDIAKRNNVSLTFTSKDKPIAVPQKMFLSTYINSSLFYENIEKFKNFTLNIIKDRIKNNIKIINIPDYIDIESLFTKLLNDPELNITKEELFTKDFYYRNIINKALTIEQIQKIKDNHLEFYVNNEKISTKNVINYYTINDLKEINFIRIKLPIEESTIEYFKYINENAVIFLEDSNLKIDEFHFFKNINSVLEKIKNHNKKYNIKFDVKNRELLSKSNLLNNLPENITLTINNDNHSYDLKTYINEEHKLNKLIELIKNSNTSPLERYIAVYNIVKQFKEYKENDQNKEESRYLRYILDNEYMVCVGYAKLLETLLQKINIPVNILSVGVSIEDEKNKTKRAGHTRNIVKIDDDKYNIHGIFIADPTWDNDITHDLYLNCLLTFDRKKEASSNEYLSDIDLIFDFHNFEEFKTKINYLLKKEYNNPFIKNKKNRIVETYRSVIIFIFNNLYPLDYLKYEYFFKKYGNLIEDNIANYEKIACEFLTEYAYYILPLVNKEVKSSDILHAAQITKQIIHKFTEEDTLIWQTEVQESYEKFEDESFPYYYDPINAIPNYLEKRKKKKG